MPSFTSPLPYRILRDRRQYQRCHILLLDEEKPSAGIEVEGQYYSFFRVVSDPDRVTQLADRLASKNGKIIVTTIPKGYAIWVYEPEAILQHLRRKTVNRILPMDPTIASLEQPFALLTSTRDYSPCQIRVPDLDKPLTGITYQGKLYSLLRIVRDEKQAQDLSQRLYKKGNQCLISSSAYGYSVWVLEPDGSQI
jgi:hypothetical protein